ncbi:MAG TPA: MFS transporter [Thermoplasmata archaeon]|nr:MFS transporter [Thermoplasmata archaeon]
MSGPPPTSDPPSEPLDGATPAPSTPAVGLLAKHAKLTGTLVVVGILASLLMGALDNFVVLTALPQIVLDLGQPNGVTFVVSSYLISSTVAIPIFGKLSDLFPRRNVFLLGLAIFIAGSLASGVSQNLNELIAFRAIQGFGSGDFFPVGISIVAVLFPPETRARIVGLLSGVFGIATVAGPLIGSYIVDNLSWRWVFYVNIPVGIVGAILLLATLGPLRPTIKRTFDVPGAALLAGWVGTLMYALIQVSDSGWAWTDPRVIGLLLATVVLFAGFTAWEIRTKEPLVPLRLFAKRVVAGSGGTAFLVGFAVFSLATFVSVFVGLVLLKPGSSSADVVRDVLYALVVPIVFGAALGGNLLTRFSYRVVTASGALISAGGFVFLTAVQATTPTWVLWHGFLPVGGIVLPLIPIGFGAGLTLPTFILAVQNEVATADVGAASGLVQFLQSLGASMGVSLLAVFQQWRFNAVAPAAPAGGCVPGAPPSLACATYETSTLNALVQSYDQLFTLMLALLLVCFAVSFLLVGRMPTGKPKSPTAAP